MIVHRPDSWSKDPSLDMLWLFYQSTDELLSNSSADTYMLPLHNSITLMFELRELYHLLKKQRFTRGYKRYKETSGLMEWKIGHIFHSIFT